jgi:hypothetical protein
VAETPDPSPMEISMSAPSRPLALSAFLAIQAVALFALGCTTWKVVEQPTPEYFAARPRTDFRIGVRGATVELTRVFLRHDSIIGTPAHGKSGTETGFATADVTQVEAHVVSAPKTVGLVVGVAAAALVVGVVVAASSFGDSWSWGSGGDYAASCPLISSWDGKGYLLDSGTFGGAITPALTRTDLDNLIHVKPDRGILRFLMTDEAEETEHVDAFAVLAVDHPTGTTVAPDARANGTYHVIGSLTPPSAASDAMQRDVLAQVARPDGRVWESRLDGRDPANPAHLRDGLDLTFPRPVNDRAQLVLDAQNTAWSAMLMKQMVDAFGRLTSGWYDTSTTATASEPLRRAQHEEGFLTVSLWNGTAWQKAGEVWEAGPEVAKRQVLPLDLTGIPGDRIRVRLESAPAFWDIDFVGLGSRVDAPVTTHELNAVSAVAPHDPDALEKLATADGRMLDMERGDTIRIEVRDAPRPARGMVRSYLSRATGWYRIHGRDAAAPDFAALAALAQPHGAARLAVTRLNEVLQRMAQEASHAGPR